ncbi:hypothetical protein BACI9J_60722 [Bacillus altitudinis]|nr:hypothetical protein BACI9J_60722 [Bacillus altitudinis]
MLSKREEERRNQLEVVALERDISNMRPIQRYVNPARF